MPEEKYMRIIALYLNGETTATEQHILEQWIARQPQNHEFFDEINLIWNKKQQKFPDFEAKPALKRLKEKITAFENHT
jgi:ferric-dicitrate binding protein FerR (iron transport regulator)